MNKHFLLFLLPTLVKGHRCIAFNITSVEERSLLAQDTKIIPQAIQDFPNSKSDETTFTGVYDCHREDGTYEVGMSAICADDGDCVCVAKFNFVDCKSCTLTGDGTMLDINSFSADCSEMEAERPNCMVKPGFQTTGCFIEDPASSAYPSFASALACVSTVMLLIIGLM